MLRVLQNWRKNAFWQVVVVPRVIRTANIFGCSNIMAYSLVRRFEHTGTSSDAQDRCDIRKQ